jgi:hypothetical protein
MPLDVHGNSFIGESSMNSLKFLSTEKCSDSMKTLLRKRISSLILKPILMTSHVVISKAEFATILAEISSILEQSEALKSSALYKLIIQYLISSEEFRENDEEDIFVFRVHHPRASDLSHGGDKAVKRVLNDEYEASEFDPIEDCDFEILINGNSEQERVSEEGEEENDFFDTAIDLSESQIKYKYEQLTRGLKLSLRYEESLLNLLERLSKSNRSDLLSMPHDPFWYYSIEFDMEYRYNIYVYVLLYAYI